MNKDSETVQYNDIKAIQYGLFCYKRFEDYEGRVTLEPLIPLCGINIVNGEETLELFHTLKKLADYNNVSLRYLASYLHIQAEKIASMLIDAEKYYEEKDNK